MNAGASAALAATVTHAPECVICGTALSGPLGYLFRLVGINRSVRNPNLCNRCNTHVEEGRVVELTVLFADLSSFTEMTRRLGPERTHAVVDAFLKAATYALVKQGAFIDKYVGDAVMAFFNAPIRYEDHGARAVAAALEIEAEMPALSDRFGVDLRAAIGIASGWAHVGRLGSGEGKDYTAIGDVVNLAARLEGQAHAGEILIDNLVYQQVADQFPNVTPEQVQLKGFDEEISAYRLGSDVLATADHASRHVVQGERSPHKSFSLGPVLFSVLGAPCAAIALVGPLAIMLGLGSVFAAFSTQVLSVLDSPPFRIPMLTLATLGAVANLYTVWHGHRLRKLAAAEDRFVPLTRRERQRATVVVSLAVLTLGFVVFELVAHVYLH
ncbi:MAG: adenylate/guanylate cyclase domain-containing protein [Chloroflexota bacterium]